MRGLKSWQVGLAAAFVVGLGSTPATAANWLKWDDVTWLDLASIHTENGLTYYKVLMLDHTVAFPSESEGNSPGRFNCATGQSWTWEAADDIDDTPAHWQLDNDNYLTKGNRTLFYKVCHS
jgi:hypothetical protein